MKKMQFRIASLALLFTCVPVITPSESAAVAGERKVKIGEVRVQGEMSAAEVAAANAALKSPAPPADKAPPAPITTRVAAPAGPVVSTPAAAPAAPVATPLVKTPPAPGPAKTVSVTTSAGKAKIGDYNPATEVILAFNNEEVKPYLKIMGGDWIENTISGEPGDYKITARFDKGGDRVFIIGLFDRKVRRGPEDALSAVILVDGVNPWKRDEEIPVAEIDKADVSMFRKYPMDGLTANATDTSGAQCYLKVVDAKEEYDFGPVKPFVIPASRGGRNLGRIDIFMFAGPAMAPEPGQVVRYGKPLTHFTINMKEWSVD